MFVTIRQTRANGKNLFQVEEGGRVLYRARTPWLDLRLPFQAENLRELTFTDPRGREVFHTVYNLLENTAHNAARYKYLFGVSAKLGEYRVVDGEGTVRGVFCTRIDGPFATRMTVECRDRTCDCYTRALGKTYVVSVYDGERQIAQITKPLDVWDRLDLYYLHLEDGSRDLLPILSFFTIYLDARRFDRPGQITADVVEKTWSYSYDRNNDRYDPDWVRRTFGQEAADRLARLLSTHPERPPADPERARRNRRLILGIAAAAVVLIVTAAALTWLLLRPGTALTAEEFTARMEAYGCTVSAETPEGEWTLAREAEGAGYSLWYLSFPTEEGAERFFARARDRLEADQTGSYLRTSTDLPGRQKYSLTSGGTYSVVSRIDGTVLLCSAPEEEKDQVRAVLKDLGY